MNQPNDILNQRLPAVRSDLEIYKGPDEADGSPSYNIYDPIRSIYFKVSWAEIALMENLKSGITVKELLEKISQNTTLRLTPEDVVTFIQQLDQQDLLQGQRDPQKLAEKSKRERPGWVKWLMFNYLFLKIPLFNPNHFLEKTIDYVKPLMTRWALYIYLFLSLWGLTIVLTRWTEFISTFPYFFNMNGILAYSVAIILTKILHEFAHAYTAKKYGLHIPTMGIAFLVLWPVLYTDATDAWRLHDRKKRLLISGAGIIAELFLAGLATIGWAFTEEGILQSTFFILASTNWIATLIINLNPALRFDGYYLLADMMGVENLQPRSFMLLRYAFYNTVAGANLPDLEPKLTKRKKRLMIIYAAYTWVYRLFLYTAIALFVYYKFTKALGVFLFILEVVIFFIWPIIYEIEFYKKIKSRIKWNFRLQATTFAIAAFLIWAIVPWPIWVRVPAITNPAQNQVIYAPNPGKIDKLYVDRGMEVKKGDPILWIESQELENQINELQKETEVIQKQLAIIQLTDENLAYYMEQQLKLAQTQAQLDGYKTQRDQNLVTAKIDGNVYEWDDYLRVNLPVANKQILGKLAPAVPVAVTAYVPEGQADYLELGEEVEFVPLLRNDSFSAVVKTISPVRSEELRFPQLASVNGGELAVTMTPDNSYKLVQSYYAVELELVDAEEVRFGRTGWIEFWGPWRSRALLGVEYVLSVLTSESGF